MTRHTSWHVIVATAAALGLASPAAAVPIEIVYADPPASGFFDPTLGGARRSALEAAADLWARTLAGDVPVVVEATMRALAGSGSSAVLATAGSRTVHRNFPGAPRADTFYVPALANQLSGADLNGPEIVEIAITFNEEVDGPFVLGSIGWYYGLDARPGSDVDFVSIAVHELGHGLGFSTFVDSNGVFLQSTPDAFAHQVVRPPVGGLVAMTRAERWAAITSGQLFWVGAHVLAAHGGPAPLFAPNPFRRGSSLAHWDVTLDELMAPFVTRANHDPGLLLPALLDLGWELAGDLTPLPSAPPTHTPAPTPTPTASATPAGAPARIELQAYVSNYDESSVSVIDAQALLAGEPLAVGAGPIGIAATPDGRLVITADFQDRTLSLISTSLQAVVATIRLPGAPTAVVVAADGRRAYVSLPDIDAVGVVDLASRRVIDVVPVGRTPSSLALTADGSVLVVAHFNEPTIGLVDIGVPLLRAKTTSSTRPLGLTAVALPANDGVGYAIAFHSRRFWLVDAGGPSLWSPRSLHPHIDVVPEAVVFSPDGAIAYFVSYVRDDGRGYVIQVDTDTHESRLLELIAVGDVPQALAITADGERLFVANTGADTVSVVEPARRRIVETIPVGAAPMGVVVVEAPVLCAGDCDASGETTVDEIIMGVNIALGHWPAEVCPALDLDVSHSITVDELIAAVNASLAGCP